MADFGIEFFLRNILICVIISIFLITKRIFQKFLTSRMQFNLWLPLLGLLAVPFLPFRPVDFFQILLWFNTLKYNISPNLEPAAKSTQNTGISDALRYMDDFALSAGSTSLSVLGLTLCAIWLLGILAMLLLLAKSQARLNALKKSALPLQSEAVRILYHNCLGELHIKRTIPIYSTAFLKSPIIVGFFKPSIYLPIHLISDCDAVGMRYMLLHELQHYKHRDPLVSCLMNFIGILYWFNPLVWFALKEMRSDREIACDTAVLSYLEERDYESYGNTLISLAEKVSLSPFPFASGIGGSMKQLQRRILHISSYEKPSVVKRVKGFAAFCIIAAILFGFAPMLSTYALEQKHYKWKVSPEKVSTIDLSSYFNEYKGSFVLYRLEEDTWQIYNLDYATLRSAPNSTYKIYDALFGLEEGVITPAHSSMTWDGTVYPFKTWNADQDLYSAMKSSVNWYFQEIDAQLGMSAVRNYIHRIGYGNESVTSDLSSYWMESSLKISTIEQVALLTDLYRNRFGFAPKNLNLVKDSICIFSSENQSLYGKTGTGRINGQDKNGWFVGFLETNNDICFFATHIQGDANAAGSNAAEITAAILSDMGILLSGS